MTGKIVCHLIDSNIETGFFRSIAAHHDRIRFPLMTGSIAPAGSLQAAMARLDVPSFSLDATKRFEYPAAMARLVAILKSNEVSILHSHCFDPTLIGLIAARIAGVRFVFTRHHSDHHIRLNKRWHTRIDAYCARRSDRVFAVSEATRDIMVRIARVPDSKVVVVQNGMHPIEFVPARQIVRVTRFLGPARLPVMFLLWMFA